MQKVSKSVLDSAYKEYARLNPKPLSRDAWEAAVTGHKVAKKHVKPKKPQGIVREKSWLEIQKEYLRWRKTDDFLKWRNKQFLKQGGTCYYCDQPLAGTRQNVEHIVPKSKGGDNRRSNLALACAACNKEKNTTLLNHKAKDALRAKNKAKKGTYHTLRETYETEYDVAIRLRNTFKD